MKKVSKKYNFLKLGALVLVLVAIPISVRLVQQIQETRSDAASYNDSKCTSIDGVCLGNSKSVKEGDSCKANGKDGGFVFGLCGGGSDRRCCVPETIGSDDDSGSPNRLKVASFNIGNARKTSKASSSSIASEIKKDGFDIVGLQEAHSGLSKEVSSKSSLTNYYHTSTAAGITIISKKALSNPNFKNLNSCGEYRAIQKSFIYVNDKAISFYNVHIDYHSSCRKKQATDVVNVIKNDPNPWILVGDFNFGSGGCSTSDSLFKDYGIVYDQRSGTRCTDMIIYSKNRGIKVVSSKTYYTAGKLSDHNIVSAIFEVE